jgi:hypothetical protein
MALRKEQCSILMFYFEDRVKDFPKRIPLCFMNAWFARYPKLKLINFDHFAKIHQLQSSRNSLGNIEAYPWLFKKK